MKLSHCLPFLLSPPTHSHFLSDVKKEDEIFEMSHTLLYHFLTEDTGKLLYFSQNIKILQLYRPITMIPHHLCDI